MCIEIGIKDEDGDSKLTHNEMKNALEKCKWDKMQALNYVLNKQNKSELKNADKQENSQDEEYEDEFSDEEDHSRLMRPRID